MYRVYQNASDIFESTLDTVWAYTAYLMYCVYQNASDIFESTLDTVWT